MKNLKKIRKSCNLTQEELADKLHIKQNTYSQYENGLREPSIEILKQLAVLFETSVDYIVGLTDEEQPYPRK